MMYQSAWAIPDTILERKDLDMTEKVLLAILIRLGGLEKPIFPRHIWLAEKMGVSEKTIQRAIKRLREVGLVKFEGRRWKIKTYSVTGQSVHLELDKVSGDSLDKVSTHNKGNKEDYNNKDIARGKMPPADSPTKPKKKDPEEPMNLEQFLDGCKSAQQRRIQIIGNYADEKKPDFTTRGQWEQFIRRNLRAAQNLSPYSDQQIARAFKKLKDAAKEGGYLSKWTLETLIKYLD